MVFLFLEVAYLVGSLREKIDTIDAELLELLNKRAETALQIGEVKMKESRPLEDSQREESVLTRAQNLNGGPLPDSSIRNIFRRVIEETKNLEREVLIDDCGNEAGCK